MTTTLEPHHDPATAPEISAVITCYFEEHTIETFHQRLSQALEATGRSYEIIFVNDGSTDRTYEKLQEIFERDPNVSVIMNLFKNSGQAAAISAALRETAGSIILSMDSDLQLDPAELPNLLREYDKGIDVVSGYRVHRRDSLFRVLPSKIANVIMRRASRSDFRDFGCTFKLYNARLVRAFNFGPNQIFRVVTVIAATQRRVEVPVSHAARAHGKSGWTFRKLWEHQMNQVVMLTERPFQYLGVFALMMAALFVLRISLGLVTPYHVLDTVTNGLILNVVVMCFLALMGVLCLVGEFAIRAYIGAQNTPVYIVRDIQRKPGTMPAPRVQ